MKRFGHNPFGSLFVTAGKVEVDEERAVKVQAKKEKARKSKRKHFLPFVLQMFNGSAWKVVYNKGELVVSNRHPSKRNKDFVEALKTQGFIKDMKIQLFGKEDVTKKELHKTPIRWRRIDRVTITRGAA